MTTRDGLRGIALRSVIAAMIATALLGATLASCARDDSGGRSDAEKQERTMPKSTSSKSWSVAAADAAASATRQMVFTRTFDAPPAAVWKAWTDGAEVRKWWGPMMFTCPTANMDVRVSGSSLVSMKGPDGREYFNTWTYSVVKPNERLEYVLRFSDASGAAQSPQTLGLPEGLPAEVPHVLVFKAIDGGRTELTITESGYLSDQMVQISKVGLAQCLDKLAVTLPRAGTRQK